MLNLCCRDHFVNKSMEKKAEVQSRHNADYSTDYVQGVRNNWTGDPCGSNYSEKEFGTKEYFEEVESHRYASHPFILNAINRFDIKGRDVLEIGFGMGTDHLNLARRGARMHGADVTAQNKDIVTRRFAYYDLTSDLHTVGAEKLPFADNSMDFIYSCGVIHHSPNTQRIVDEIHRVLKPGGKCWIAVYNKHSVYFLWSLFLYSWILRGGFRRDTLRQRMSRIEYPGTATDIHVDVFSSGDMRRMFSRFTDRKVEVHQMVAADVSVFGRLLPDRIWQKLGRFAGWYVCMEATK